MIHQLGGATKAFDVAQGFYRFFAWRPYMLVAALADLPGVPRWPRVGRALLAATPLALWLAAQRPQLWGAGYVIVYAWPRAVSVPVHPERATAGRRPAAALRLGAVAGRRAR